MSVDASQHSSADSDVRRRLGALTEINLVGKVSSVEVLEQVTRLATDLLPATLGASVALVDPDDTFRVVASTVPGQVLGDDGTPIGGEGGSTRRICESLQPVVVSNIDIDDNVGSPLAEELGVKAYAGVPIAMDDRCLGVLYVLDLEPRDYSVDDIEFLKLLAGRASTAVHHAGVLAEMRSARERSEAMAWVANAVIAADDLDEVLGSAVEGVAAAVAADEAEIVTVDREGTAVLRYARSGTVDVEPDISTLEGIVGAAIREDRVIISGEGKPPGVVAPLHVGGSVLGALSVQRASGPRFDEGEVDLVVAMANQVAIAIDNVRLLDTTRFALRETEAMYQMSQALVAVNDLGEMMDAVVGGTVAAVPAAGGRILMANDGELTAQASAGTVGDAEWGDIVSGEVGRVLRTGEVVHQARLMVVPLAVHGRLLGALEAMNGAPHRPFTAHQLETLQAVAAQAAVAIENHLLFGEVQRLAITDELTGVHTRRHLFELGQREFAQSVRFRKPLSAIMFDLDHFKEINDTLGHLVGDEVLVGVAERCHDVLREVDVLGRYGGEEFAVILPDASTDDALTVAERVRRAVAQDPVETARGPVAVTVSIGVAEAGPGVLDLKTLLDRADAAMYAAKAAGRDRVMAA